MPTIRKAITVTDKQDDWIKSQISAILSSGKDVRFPTIPLEALDKQHLEEYIKRTRPLLWLVVGGNPPD